MEEVRTFTVIESWNKEESKSEYSLIVKGPFRDGLASPMYQYEVSDDKEVIEQLLKFLRDY